MIENNLASIAKSLEIIATALTAKNANLNPISDRTQPVSVPVPSVAVAVPNVPAVPTQDVPVMGTTPPMVTVSSSPVVASPSNMPAPPVFTAPVASTSLAFADKQAMMDFVISSYKSLGAEKGARIQGVLEAMGYKNINDVAPEQWGQLKAGIEALAK